MKKNLEYREPEFTVVKTAQQDVLTASGEGILGAVSSVWDTIGNGGGLSFGL
jgi:hypothetical protein